MTMVVRMFHALPSAQCAIADLIDSGFARNAISVLVRDQRQEAYPAMRSDHEHGALARTTNLLRNRVLAGGPLAATLRSQADDESAVVRALINAGLQPAAARLFAEAIGGGAILVAVHCMDATVRDARDILDGYAAPECADRDPIAALRT